ncbi:vitamin B12 ABC transporter permease BtuC [Natranaeroarchaeum aerophilus]|uniref:vitamin B12 ABC transporter permease BtuC n=1 Tax=Natranaeroarchaeum aerophilus TaxID=2917711 RepID=UPI00336A2C5C
MGTATDSAATGETSTDEAPTATTPPLLRKTAVWTAGLGVVLLITIVVSATIGPVEIATFDVVRAVLDELSVPVGIAVDTGHVTIAQGASLPYPSPSFEYRPLFDFAVAETTRTIVVNIRLPRILLGAIVGFALASAGTVMQGFFRNPLADPSIIGVSSGAAVGAVATITIPGLAVVDLRLAAFVGALITAFAVYAMATEGGRTPVATLLLAGVAVQTFLGAVISYLLLRAGDSLEEAVYWLMGHLHYSTWDHVLFAFPVAIIGFAVLAAYTRDLNVLLLGEEDAQHLGIEVERTKRVLLAVSSLITAAAVAVSGVIGFVGLVVPHIMRLLVGPDHRILLPTSAVAGAAFLVAADTLARSGAAELPVGIVTAAIGAPFFLFLLLRREVHGL